MKILSSILDGPTEPLYIALDKIDRATIWANASSRDFSKFLTEEESDLGSKLRVLRDFIYTAVYFDVSIDQLKEDVAGTIDDLSDEKTEKLKATIDKAADVFLNSALALSGLLEGGNQFIKADSIINERPIFDKNNGLIGYVMNFGLDISYHRKNERNNIYINLDIDDLESLELTLLELKSRRKQLISRYSNAKIKYFRLPEEEVDSDSRD